MMVVSPAENLSGVTAPVKDLKLRRLGLGNVCARRGLPCTLFLSKDMGLPANLSTIILNYNMSKDDFEGHVDFYGCHSKAKGWFVGGWLSHPWPLGHRPQNAVADFPDLCLEDHTHSVFYHRDDVHGRGIGFIFFLKSAAITAEPLQSLQLVMGDVAHCIWPTPDVLQLDEPLLIEHLRNLLDGGDDGSQRQEMRSLLVGQEIAQISSGFVDLYGYHAVAGGWLFSGWLSVGWKDEQPPERAVVSFEDGDVGGQAFGILYPRQDLENGAAGVVLFVSSDVKPLGKLVSLSFEAGGVQATLSSAAASARLREGDLITKIRPLIGKGTGLHRDILLSLAARQPYQGEDTLSSLGITVFLEIDEAIQAGPTGLVLMGWFLCHPGEVREIRVRCGHLITTLDLRDSIRVTRQDVVDGFAQQGFTDARCGFIAYLAQASVPNSRVYIEVETINREVGFRNVPRPKLEGIAAIKRLLAAVDVRFAQVADAYDRVLGPAIEGLNRSRLAVRPSATVTDYGTLPASPRWSVIVPLYGRLDFVEYQLALFSAGPDWPDAEFIYVLDEPARQREAQFLFASVYQRYRVPFRAVLLDENVGYAPANNIGLSHASGSFVTFLNSDVFPGTPDWLSRLSASLAKDTSIGLIGPLLQFEDESIQHRGMFFERLPEFGDWYFGMHYDKGMRYTGNGAPETHLSITGACMMMSRVLAEQLGGFDETYVIGDFEDSDLCLRAQALGYRCIVDPTVRLYHLERKSQASSGLGWRMNLTVYNAWQHERRWGATIDAKQAQP